MVSDEKEVTLRSAPAEEDFFPSLEGEYVPPPRRSRRMWWIASVLAVAAAASTLLWRYATEPPPPTFQTARIERGRIDLTTSATGTCNAVVDVQVGSQVSGNIKALYADFNTRVKQGQLVALIDPAPFEAAVKQAHATLTAAKASVVTAQATLAKAQSDVANAQANVADQKANLEKANSAADLAKIANGREQALLQGGIVAQQDADTAKASYDQAVAGVDAAQASVNAAQASEQSAQKQVEVAQTQVDQAKAVEQQDEAALAQAQLNLEHTRIVAPVDGTVIARNMDVGQTVAASFQAPTIFNIAQDLTKMQVDTNVAESDIGRLQVGQPATFTVDAYPTTIFHGTVSQIRKSPINVQNVITYDAVIQVANPDLKLFPGMTANVTILVDRKDSILKLPNAALRVRPPKSILVNPAAEQMPLSASEALVYMPAPDAKLRAVPIQMGISDGSFTEIVKGDFQEGQSVVVGVTMPTSTPKPEEPRLPRRV